VATRPISIKIIGDDSNLRKSLKGASRKLEGFGKSVAKFGVGAGVAFAGVAAAAATKGITAFSDFEKGMKEVMTLLPDAGEEAFGDLSSQVKDFSKEFGVLPDKAIPALYSALSAGVPKDNVFEFMEIAQKAAKGGVTELETAVDALSSVVNAYGSEAITATESSDLLLTAVRLGKTTFEELAAEVYKVAPIAASVGVPFENLTASIAVLTSQGVPTAQSATMLKGALAELAKEGTKADKAFRDFAGEGLSSFMEGGGTFEEAIMGLATQAETAGVSVLDLFGSVEAGQAILSLTSDGGAAFSSVLGEMGNSAGATQAAFETMDTGLSASFDKIKANIAVMAIETGERLAPHVLAATELIITGFQKMAPHIERAREVVKAFAQEFIERAIPVFHQVVEAIKVAVQWIKDNLFPIAVTVAAALVVAYEEVREALIGAFEWMMEHKDFSIILGGAVAGLVAGLIVWKTVTMAIAAAQKVAAVATAALNLVMSLNPVMIVVVALVALAGALVAAYFRFEEVRVIVDSVWQKLQGWMDWLWGYLQPTLEAILAAVIVAFEAVLEFFQEDFIPLVKATVEVLTDIWRGFADFFTEYLWPIIKAAFIGITSVIDNFWDVIKSMVALVKALFSGDFKEVWFKLRTMIGEIIDFIVDLFLFLPIRIFNASRPLLGKFALIVSDFAVHLLGKIVKLIQAIPDQIIEFMSGIATDILNVGKDIGGWIIDGLIAAVKAAAGAIAAAVRSVIPDVGGMVSGAVGKVGGFLGFGATGGIVTQPTLAVIGESGPEAVVPLSRTPGSSPLPGGGNTINIVVNAGMGTDGHQVGNQIVSALKQWERANGSLPLNVSAA